MKRIGIFLIIFGIVLVAAYHFFSFTLGDYIFTNSLDLAEIFDNKMLGTYSLVNGKYNFVIKARVSDGVLDSRYRINIENSSGVLVQSVSGRLYGNKENALIKNVTYGTKPFTLLKSDKYSINFKLFHSKHKAKISDFLISLKRKTLDFNPVYANILLVLVLLGLALLLFSGYSKQRIKRSVST